MSNLSFSVISDSHILHFGWGEKEFERAVKFHTEHFEEDAFVFLGDIIYQLDSAENGVCNKIHSKNYDIALNIAEKYIGEAAEKIYVLGNHEFPQNNDDEALNEEALRVWQEKFKQPVREHRVINGYHFIKYPVRAWREEINADDEKWLIEEFEKAKEDGENKPIFVISHKSAKDTVGILNNSGAFSENICSYFSKQTRMIHITGHLHYHICDEKAIFQNGSTVISAPVCAVGGLCFAGDDKGNEPVFGISQGLHFEVEENKVKIFRIDYTSGKIYEKLWIIDTDETKEGIFRYGKDREDKTACNSFAEDAYITVRQTEALVEVSIRQSFVNDNIVEYYGTEFIDDTGKAVYSFKQHTDFYNIIRDIPMQETYTISMKNIEKGSYTVRVTPYNCFFNTDGRALEAKAVIK